MEPNGTRDGNDAVIQHEKQREILYLTTYLSLGTHVIIMYINNKDIYAIIVEEINCYVYNSCQFAEFR